MARKTDFTLDQSRRQLLENLAAIQHLGSKRVEWMTSNDAHVCPLCAARDGQIYTIEEARKIIQADLLCRPQNPYANWCRCVIMPAAPYKEVPHGAD